MKIVFTAQGETLEAPLDPRFGRAAKFIVVDTDNGALAAHDNAQNLNAAQGAGIQAAQTVAGLGVQAVVTGNCGPKAFRVLRAAGIQVFTTQAATVAEALALYHAGTLTEAKAANVEGHWA
jgi:predicted Fe-Mo cluster-binding NifX family protein